MSIRVRISPALQQFTGGKEVVETMGYTTGECLDNLEFQFPGIKQKICDKQGQVLSPYDIYVNGQTVYPEELTKRLFDGDEMAIMAIMAGG